MARSTCSLVADIGGTNARFAIVGDDGLPRNIRTLPVARYADPASACRAYLDAVGQPHLQGAALAVAGTVSGDRFKLTNAHWLFERRVLRHALGVRDLLLLNDFTAIAWSLPTLRTTDGYQLGGHAAVKRAPLAVLGPGTGLGVSGLVPAGDRWLAISGEGGHASFSPADGDDLALLNLLWRQHGHVSFERLLSGEGLVLLANALAQQKGSVNFAAPADAAGITSAALRGEPWARETVLRFCALLGTAAGNFALTLGARGGVYLAGGIVPRFGRLLAQSKFRQRFEAKGRFAPYLQQIPCFVITADQPGLRGAALALVS